MNTTDKKRKAFIEKLSRENRKFYGTQDGRGTLRAFELTFEHRWIYLFELVQNALDAGARSIALRLAENGDGLTFQHDGKNALDEKDVEGLSKVFRSTKGASSVGFMGVGFKSVFGRFREARISGWGWKFRYEINQVVGKTYGDRQPDLLGAVVPIWDDAIAPPDRGFTTRFEMRRLTDAQANLKSDLAYFLPDEDRTPLAILAASKLKRLEVSGRVWELSVSKESDGSLQAAAVSEDENLRWQLFPVRFKPSKEAIARFLEHRRIQPSKKDREKVYKEAARFRRVLGVLPLDRDGMPAPPGQGRVYATLPTEVTLPFGIHINADWLLNISRTGLREIEDNAWQRDIADRIADVLARFLNWVARPGSTAGAAKQAFSALACPSAEDANGLEMLLAEERWLSRLRAKLEDAAVLPVWAEQSGSWTFAKPSETIVPPLVLRKAFAQLPALQPAVLMKGYVLRSEILGPDAHKLLKQAGLLSVISPSALERSWNGGLEYWWEALEGDDSERRDLLFHLWGAVAELASQDNWAAIEIPCVRIAADKWIPVNESVFFNEPLPSEKEPGGAEMLQFIQSFFPDKGVLLPEVWIGALRRSAAKEGWRRGPLSQAREWIEEYGRSIKLLETIETAVKAMETSPNPDWLVLLPLGRWAMHRERADLLIRVLVESENGTRGVPTGEALLADPYVERGKNRRILFPTMPPISSEYLEWDSANANKHEWREFFEKAGAQGKLRMVYFIESRVNCWERERVAKFLGIETNDFSSSNRDYTLVDFDIEPGLPEMDDPHELRAALAPWLEDGFGALCESRREAKYFPLHARQEISFAGKHPSAWVTRLSELEWVPCDDDGRLRQPKDVLPEQDPARAEAPAAKLSPELVEALEEHGVRFGTTIPEAAPLRKLLALGSRLDAEGIASLLRECREQIETDDDRRHFELALRQLTLPSKDNRHAPLDRIVQRTGGRLRGALGGWIISLEYIDEALREELEHADFPCDFPETTTGGQALAYIRDVWERARSSPKGLANEVRDVLPTAYAYCLEDIAKDDAFAALWESVVPQAAVFSELEWVLPAKQDIYLDDIEDRRFFPGQAELRTATGGHLGASAEQRERVAGALGLKPLSSTVEQKWSEKGELPVNDWFPRFDLVCRLLRHVRSSGQAGEESGAGTGLMTAWRFRRVESLDLEVSVEGAPAESVPVNARLHGGALTVAGRPVQFGADAAKELLRALAFGQRADLSADLTAMLTAIDNESDFALAADKFRRSCAPDFDLPDWVARSTKLPETEPEAADELESPPPAEDIDSVSTESEAAEESSAPQPPRGAPSSGDHQQGGVRGEGSNEQDEKPPADENKRAASQETDKADTPRAKTDASSSGGGSYDRKRALGQSKAAVHQLLIGEITPESSQDGGTRGEKEGLGDEIYREIAARYEKEAGREPQLGAPHQAGWDLRSVDPATGEERLIEVKGKGRPWTENEVVELSRAQALKAFEEQAPDSWYLYVVERVENGDFQVLPVPNPIRNAGKWMLSGLWREAAENPKRIANAPR